MAWEVVLATLAAAASVDAPRRASLHAPVWRGVEEISLSCTPTAAAPDLCALALAEARRGAPMAVRPADRAAGGLATLNLHLAASNAGGALVLRISGERAEPIDESQGALLPRSTRAAPGERAGEALARAFDAVLPWRRTPAVAGPLRPIR